MLDALGGAQCVFGLQVLADANKRRGWAYTVRLPSQLIRDIYDRHLISSVGRAPVCPAGGHRFKPRPDQESAAYV